mgnify:CR=1 FL=1
MLSQKYFVKLKSTLKKVLFNLFILDFYICFWYHIYERRDNHGINY